MQVCFPKEARAEFSAASSKAGKSLFSLFAALVAVAGLALCHSAYASAFTVTSATSGSTTTFTVTRDSADASETVLYRTVSRTALDGVHFAGASGTLTFAAGFGDSPIAGEAIDFGDGDSTFDTKKG